MALNFAEGSKKKTDFGRIEDGSYPARVQGIIDLGIQADEWEGETKENHKVFVTFEFPTEKIMVEDVERPRWLSREYAVSNNEKSALYGLLKATDPDGKITNKGRNVKALLGLPLMVTVGSTKTGNAKIAGVARLMKGVTVGELENPTLFLDLSDFDVVAWKRLPQWLQDKIKTGVDFNPDILTSAAFDDVPESPF